ncbi:MAG: helix-turn-helix domain-containing protein [Candidatus Aquicultorales bacterium]
MTEGGSLSDQLLTVEEIAKLLCVPESWVYGRTAREEIPHVHVGRYVRFFERQVLDWLNEQSSALPDKGP